MFTQGEGAISRKSVKTVGELTEMPAKEKYG
jgi:hypothetical protein